MFIFYYANREKSIWIADTPEKFIEIYNNQYDNEFKFFVDYIGKDQISLRRKDSNRRQVWQFKKIINNSEYEFDNTLTV